MNFFNANGKNATSATNVNPAYSKCILLLDASGTYPIKLWETVFSRFVLVRNLIKLNVRCESWVRSNAHCAIERMTHALAAYDHHFFSSRHLVCHVECARKRLRTEKETTAKTNTENNGNASVAVSTWTHS